MLVVFPDGNIDVKNNSLVNDFTTGRPRRIVVRKRLRKKIMEPLYASESELSNQVVEFPVHDNENSETFKNSIDSIDDAVTTSFPIKIDDDLIESKRMKRKRRKKTKVRTLTSTTEKSVDSSSNNDMHSEIDSQLNSDRTTTTMKPNRKLLYDTKSRTNFLKRQNSTNPNGTQFLSEPDEEILPVETTTTTQMTTSTTLETTVTETSTTEKSQIPPKLEFTTRFSTTERSKPPETSTTLKPIKKQIIPKILQQANRVDSEHKVMIETLHKALSAIHSGVDIKKVENFIEQHQAKLKLQKESSRIKPKPNRGSVKFRMPEVTEFENIPLNLETMTPSTTERISGRITVKKSPRIKITTTTPQPFSDSDSGIIAEELNMPPRLKTPVKFRPAPFYGLTMSKSLELSNEEMEKIHKTFQLPKSLQNGFFPVIENGTPSVLL